MKKAIFISTLFISLSFFAALPIAQAQMVNANGTTSLDGIDIQANPANPTPGLSVTVSLVSYSSDLSGAKISWSVNGKTQTSGTGNKSAIVTAPAAGKSIQVIATINTLTGARIQKAITITSGSVDLIWETSGYVPPLYLGKIPFTYQNAVKIIAMPQLMDSSGKIIDPKNLTYQWKENTFNLGDQSGYGKQNLTIIGSVVAQPLTISVTVTSSDGSQHAQNQIILSPTAASIALYQDDPLYGVLYNSAVENTLQIQHNQTKITAAPFGFDLLGKGIVYNWSINGNSQDSLSSSSEVILGVNPGEQGSSNVSLNIQNNGDQILQTAQAHFTATFSSPQTASSTLF